MKNHELFGACERDTITLQFYQASLASDPQSIPREIQVAAANGRLGKEAALSVDEIDDLCERING